MPNLETTGYFGGDSGQVVGLRKSFRQVGSGWVCNVCAAHVIENGDAEKHLEWHAVLSA